MIHTTASPLTAPSVAPDIDALRWLRQEVAAAACRVPLPGSGATIERWRYLAAVGHDDLVHCRLIEGHLDAVAILQELSDLASPGDGPLGVWAADPDDLIATPDNRGWSMVGQKRYCSGSLGLDGALVTATAPDGPRLFRLRRVDLAKLSAIDGSWPSIGMSATASETIRFDLRIGPDAAIGVPGAYVERRGFWAGGAGVAVCWLGGARGVIDRLGADTACAADPTARRELGRIRARLDAVAALAREAARVMDQRDVPLEGVRATAIGLRVAVADAARAALAVDLEIGGTRLNCLDAHHSRHIADLGAYLTQLGAATIDQVAAPTGPVL